MYAARYGRVEIVKMLLPLLNRVQIDTCVSLLNGCTMTWEWSATDEIQSLIKRRIHELTESTNEK